MQDVESVFTHGQPAAAVDGMLPGIFSALSLWVPTLGADVYLVHRYPDTQGKMYTYKGSGNAEFQRTRCPGMLLISACVVNFSIVCESPVLL